MAQCLILEERKEWRELLQWNLKHRLGVEPMSKDNVDEGIALLDLLPSIQTVLLSPQKAQKLFGHEDFNRHDADFVILGDYEGHLPDGIKPHIIDRLDDEKVVLYAIATILAINPDELQKKLTPEFIPVEPYFFYTLGSSIVDIYIRIKKGPMTFQYVKRLHAGDSFDKKDIVHYEGQGLKFFYIPKRQFEAFSNFLSNHLIDRLENIGNLPLEQRMPILSKGFHAAHAQIMALGLNHPNIQLSESVISGVLHSIYEKAQTSDLVKKVINSGTGKMYQQCHMISMIAGQVLSFMDYQDSAIHREMAFAAFYHDISLANHQELFQIDSENALKQANLKKEQQSLVLNHALNSAKILKDHPEIPQGTYNLVLHHHGSLNGIGFYPDDTKKIPGLSKIFIVVCEFVTELMRFKEAGGQGIQVLDTLYQKFQSEDMAKVVVTLENSFRRQKRP